MPLHWAKHRLFCWGWTWNAPNASPSWCVHWRWGHHRSHRFYRPDRATLGAYGCGARPPHCAAGSALLGAALVLAADAVARTAVKPAELPLGVLTAFIGVPMFLFMLRHFRGRV